MEQVDAAELPRIETSMVPTYLERRSRDLVIQACHYIEASRLVEFSRARIEKLLTTLEDLISPLDLLPEATFLRLFEVIQGLRAARNELQLADFLFEVEEIDPVHRFVMRSRAILRGKSVLEHMLQVWPLFPS